MPVKFSSLQADIIQEIRANVKCYFFLFLFLPWDNSVENECRKFYRLPMVVADSMKTQNPVPCYAQDVEKCVDNLFLNRRQNAVGYDLRHAQPYQMCQCVARIDRFGAQCRPACRVPNDVLPVF